MSKIVFLKDKDTIYEGHFEQIGSNQIRITFIDNHPSDEDILLSGFNLINEHNGYVQTVRDDYKYIYRTYKDNELIVELCNDGIEYVEPEPIPERPYEPTPDELEIYLQQNKKNKINLSKSMLAEYLENNPIHSIVHGGLDGVYSVTNEKQTLMMSQYMTYQIEKSVNPDAKLTWNETGKACEEWTEEEFLQLILEIKAYVYPLVSYQQHIEENIYNCSTQEDLDLIEINFSKVCASM